jgi:hypothetical protein
MGDTTMPNLSGQPMNQFHSRTTIDGLAPSFGMSRQTTASMFGQGYTQVAPSFSMSNFNSTPYTPGVMVEHTLTPTATTKPHTPP